MVKRVIVDKEYTLPPEAVARLKALADREPDTSDIPEAAPEQLKILHRQAQERRKKQMFSLRLSNETLQWWQGLGSGYTALMARFLDAAKNHPEWVSQVI
ncbi:MAG: BrnA antitoxin family protein [Treponema sp.]|jgi:uncharacterized protein (DUF4415 family)|nr:BrnA antitoxin family protein [Treponema sp.]